MGVLEVDLLLRLYEEVKMLVGFSGVDGLGVPKSDVAVPASSDDLFIDHLHEFDGPVVARLVRTYRHHRLHQIALPKQ